MKASADSKKSSRPKRRKLVEHQQQPVPSSLCMQVLGQPAADLIEDQAHQRLGPADVGGRHDEVERAAARPRRDRRCASRTARDLRHDGIAVKAEERHGGRQHARAFVLALVQELARG